jgi:hypothetical protein
MKPTAVEWLVEQYLKRKGFLKTSDIEQAKAMEKEKMIQFCTEYATSLMYGDGLTPTEFYNQTFNKETK